MTPEKYRAHAHLARTLIRACGGLEEAAGVCRLQKSRLQEFTDPTKAALMPIDVVEALQEYCGQLLYYEGLAAMLPCQHRLRGVQEEACELTEAVVSLQAYVRRAVADGSLSPNEKQQIAALIQEAERPLRCVRQAAERGQP